MMFLFVELGQGLEGLGRVFAAGECRKVFFYSFSDIIGQPVPLSRPLLISIRGQWNNNNLKNVNFTIILIAKQYYD